jgi:hypothetical protein
MIFAPFAFQNSVPGIVTSNLLLHYDAGNVDSYPGTGTSWNNLEATSLTSTLTNGPTYSTNNGGVIVFDGVDDYATRETTSDFNFGTGDFTIEAWVKIVGNSSTNAAGIRNATVFSIFPTSGGLASTYAFTISGNTTTTGTGLIFAGRNSAATLQSTNITFSFTQNEFYQIGISHRSGVTKFFVNGVAYSASINLNIDLQTSTRPINIARLGFGGSLQNLNGTVGLLRIYNGKGLTDSEILQNYNVNSNRI